MAPNFKGQTNIYSHIFIQTLLPEKHSSLANHTISTANKIRKQPEAVATIGVRDTSRGRQFNNAVNMIKRKAPSPKSKGTKSAASGCKEMFSKKVENIAIPKKEVSKDVTVKNVKINMPL